MPIAKELRGYLQQRSPGGHSVSVDFDHCGGEGLGRFLREVMANAALDGPVRILAREFVAIGRWVRERRTIGVAFKGDRGHIAGAAEITVAVLQDGKLRISVLDRGPGIPEDALEAVFEPFYRLEASRNRHTGGTGLGLAIARQLTLAMNATLALHNRPDGGLEARLILKNAS